MFTIYKAETTFILFFKNTPIINHLVYRVHLTKEKNVKLTHNSTPELMINKWETNKKTSSKIQHKTYQGTSWMGWGPVDWVGRVLPEAKFEEQNAPIFLFERPTPRYLQKTVLGNQLNGLGTSWMGGEGPPRSKIRKKCTSFFELFLFERPLLRYL